MRRLGFVGNIQEVFNKIDTNQTGAITLKDLDPTADQLLVDFRTLLLKKYGTYIKAWQALDTNRNGVLEEHELVEQCAKLDFRDQEQAQLLFKYLLDSPGKVAIHMADLDPGAMQAYYRGDIEALSWLEKAKKLRLQIASDRQAELDLRMGSNDWKTLKKDLILRYGSILSAWRQGLDYSVNGKISFTEFSKACRNMGFLGNVQKIFAEMDTDGSGIITFDEVDHTWFVRIQNFHQRLLSKYNTYEGAWRALDANRNNMLEEVEFEDVCTSIGYTDSSPKDLFMQLRHDKHQKHLTLQDIDCQGVILKGVLTAGGTMGKDDMCNTKASLTSSNTIFMRRDDDLLSPQEKAKIDLANSQKLRASVKDKQLAANCAKSLKQLLVRKYGSITAAWRQGLNFSGNGKCSFIEFSKACRDVGFNGNIKAAFKEMNPKGKGIITFDELDHEWFTKLSLFRDLCEDHFGNLANSLDAFDKNKNNTIEVEEVEEVCKAIGYSYDPEALFKQLRRDPARKFITMDDINAKGVITWAATRFEAAGSTIKLNTTASKVNTANDSKAQLARSAELSGTGGLSSTKGPTRYFQ